MLQQNKLKASQTFDMIIVGGGPVGLLTAYMLTQKQFRVALIDRLDYDTTLKAEFDGRTFAYAFGSKVILEDIGLWRDLEPHATPIKDIVVTADYKTYRPQDGLHYQANRIAVDGFDQATQAMGYNIETRHFKQYVFNHLINNDCFTLYAPDEIEKVVFESHKASITLKSGLLLTAPLVVGCDGKQSVLRSHVGIDSKVLPYHQKALVGLMHHEYSHNNTAYEHFLKSGPLAILPMQDCEETKKSRYPHQSGFIWSLKNDRADYMHALSNDQLSQDIESYFKPILGSIQVTGNRWLFPLEATVVKAYTSNRLVLVGDAAHSIHPVAGQGFNLGIRDAYALTQHLVVQRGLGLDYGTLSTLKPYEQSRRTDILSMTSMCHGLVRLFSNDVRSLDHLRKWGLKALNKVPSVKDHLTKRAMGI